MGPVFVLLAVEWVKGLLQSNVDATERQGGPWTDALEKRLSHIKLQVAIRMDRS
jgi:hypothetical protein